MIPDESTGMYSCILGNPWLLSIGDESYVCPDVSKTKDVSTDFRKENVQPQLTIIHSETVDSVDRFKYLGMVMDSKQKFGNNCDIIFKKGLAATALSEKTQIF